MRITFGSDRRSSTPDCSGRSVRLLSPAPGRQGGSTRVLWKGRGGACVVLASGGCVLRSRQDRLVSCFPKGRSGGRAGGRAGGYRWSTGRRADVRPGKMGGKAKVGQWIKAKKGRLPVGGGQVIVDFELANEKRSQLHALVDVGDGFQCRRQWPDSAKGGWSKVTIAPVRPVEGATSPEIPWGRRLRTPPP